ncbi:DNA/RNA helicase domain-containing protein [Saccharothrix ecbatanensis]|uniref:DNA/RNA helicase domain-containing protein n=1 Tax=Saccharothrix ecbatanensis TaxID=1105145 RepID=UPI00161B75C4|nr:DNA/RNA helicase domain-containing protein [Saccharothrix ecbatanensis]
MGETREAMRSSPRRFTRECADRFEEQHGEPPGAAELRSWTNSWPVLLDALDRAGQAGSWLLLEYTLAGSAERVDALVLGARPRGGLTGVVVELKQWSRCTWTSPLEVALDDVVRTHPCRQAFGYTSHLEGWLEEATLDLEYRGVAFLHNAPVDVVHRLRHAVVDSHGSRDVPIVGQADLSGTDGGELARLLRCEDLRPPTSEQVDKFVRARQRPSKSVFEDLDNILSQKSEFRLLGDQQTAQVRVLRTLDPERTTKRQVIAVTGGPGTGKTVIALRLLADIPRIQSPRGEVQTRFITPSGTLRRQLVRATELPGAKQLFLVPDSFRPSRSDAHVIPLIDEAQRLRRSDRTLDRLIHYSPVSVFFLDERQVIRPNEGVSVSELAQTAERFDAEFTHITLTSQFRCGGSQRYLNWLDRLFSVDGEAEPWVPGQYEVGLAANPDELSAWIRARGRGGRTARISAGFCWEWSKDGVNRPLSEDVVIEWTDEHGGPRTWRRPWNSMMTRMDGDAVTAPQREFWATDAGGENQVGCVYTAQALEYDYSGVIIGPDLVRRDGEWVGRPEHSHDDVMENVAPDAYRQLALNTYWVLATRGTSGCRFHSTDPETQDFLMGLFASRQELSDPSLTLRP